MLCLPLHLYYEVIYVQHVTYIRATTHLLISGFIFTPTLAELNGGHYDNLRLIYLCLLQKSFQPLLYYDHSSLAPCLLCNSFLFCSCFCLNSFKECVFISPESIFRYVSIKILSISFFVLLIYLSFSFMIYNPSYSPGTGIAEILRTSCFPNNSLTVL